MENNIYSYTISYDTVLNNPIVFTSVKGGDSQRRKKRDVNMGEIPQDTIKDFYIYLCGEYRKQLTIRNYYSCVQRFLTYIHNCIDAQNIQQWKIWANNHYRRIGSLNSNINAINIFLKWYYKDDLNSYNNLKLRVMPRTPSDEYSLTQDEYEKLLVQSRQNIELALIFELLNHLLRPSEIINLKLKDRDKDILYLNDTKTGNNHIIMNKNLMELWDRYLRVRPIPLEEHREYLLIDNESKWRGHRFKTTLPIRNRIYELGRQAGINRRVKPYTIKRTCITLMLDKDSRLFAGDPELVRMMARHKKLDTTMKYNRKDESYIRKYHEQNVYTIPEQEKTSPSKSIGDKLYTLQIHNISPQICLNEDGIDNSSISFSTIFYLFFDDELINIFHHGFGGDLSDEILSLF
jgi:integrase